MAKQVQAVGNKTAFYYSGTSSVSGNRKRNERLMPESTRVTASGELRYSSSSDPQVATEISKLLEQANYYNHLADQKDEQPRLEILHRIVSLES
ncbi:MULTISPECIES: hypothetical protein [Paenibacillus]|jgi:hypothetical protein|uniref:hypothetical protein n=1 Tax=Paenibacillus TaxID=44249 RepID=UPI00096C0092|nr:hypothetical protein [Paenibacillus odorifer]OMD84118.1 hypothetical protein BSK67_30055 [Paenibacillus odorifer]